MKTKDKTLYFIRLRSDLIEIRNSTGLYNKYLDLISETHLKLNPQVTDLWGKLMGWNPGVNIYSLLEVPDFEHITSLPEWGTIFITDFSSEIFLPNKALVISDLVNYNKIQIWENPSQEYWRGIPSSLERWQEITQNHLAVCKWGINERYVEFRTQWTGEFENIYKIPMQTLQEPLWVINFGKKDNTSMAKTANALLLDIQLHVLHGCNLLIGDVPQKNVFNLVLKIPRADTFLTKPPVSPINENVINEGINLIFTLIGPGYTNASQQLEQAILNEVVRLQPLMEEEDVTDEDIALWFDKVKEVPNQLAVKRQFFTDTLAEIEKL